MKAHFLFKKDFWKDFFKQLTQFLITIVLLSSIGIWLPLIPDWWNYSFVTNTTCEGIPFNLMTYFSGITAVAIYERIRYLLKADMRNDKEVEYAFWFITGIVFIILCGVLMKKVKNRQIDDAIFFGLFCTIITYLIWWLVYYKRPKAGLYGALGQEQTN